LRILISIHHELDRNAGAPGATWRLSEAYRALGHDVDLLCFDDMAGSEGMKRYCFPWFIAREIAKRPAYDVYDLSSGDGWVAEAMRRMVLHEGPGHRSLVVARSHGLEHVVHESLVDNACQAGQKLSWKYPIYNGGFRLWECRQSFRNADLSLFLNQFDIDYAVEKLKVPRERTALVMNGVDEPFIRRARELVAEEDTTRPAVIPRHIAFIGTYIDRKGIRFLRDAMVSIMTRYSDATLGFFGTGVDDQTILNDYPEALRERIKITRRYNNQQLPQLLKDYHIQAFPSLTEGFPLSPIEAMSCGLVPIISDIPGPTGIVAHEKNGLVVPRADTESLIAATARLMDHSDLWMRLRATGLAGISKFDWKTIAMDTLKLYEEFLQDRSR